MCAVMSIAFLILLVGIIVSVKKDYEDCAFALGCIAAFVFIAAVYQGHELVCWIESPQAKTMEYVLQYMN